MINIEIAIYGSIQGKGMEDIFSSLVTIFDKENMSLIEKKDVLLYRDTFMEFSIEKFHENDFYFSGRYYKDESSLLSILFNISQKLNEEDIRSSFDYQLEDKEGNILSVEKRFIPHL
ncbi:hypothetical protein [Spirosoma foliorum]|uniref:Uncharacterized protein n=1 Tax=Spirosoma foliorum TaxID=2710596 RepID=A0A7G5GWT7_9BACT|nr:hypothetical protein [Spirosoma foliorum]QMW03329.1 hypothetical protein H3H32_36675 [Spirosoma foliorum]